VTGTKALALLAAETMDARKAEEVMVKSRNFQAA